ncbi:hypothetical protein FGIG_06629 [Fasciola gigantica]|uniref:Uncharacterized protein n=1 Tax=Fasciola gigantica TaxID=46835 RepID=A0A504Y9S6_FASGI|nr:hypothetical protein FGIG_06629 [Fasciola gigantica]
MGLTIPGPLLLKRVDRSSKYDPLEEEVDLFSCNPDYALVKLPDGRTKNVPIHQLARGDKSPPSTDESPLRTPPGDLPQDQSTSPDVSERLTVHVTDDVQTHKDPRDDTLFELLSRQQRKRAYSLRNREA